MAWASLEMNSSNSQTATSSSTWTTDTIWQTKTTAGQVYVDVTPIISNARLLFRKPKQQAPRFPVEAKSLRQKIPELKARHGFQQLARIPNYRGRRTR